jgi:hypothetical protein
VDQPSRHLRDALVAAFRPYLSGRLAERGWPVLPVGVAEAAAEWLAAALDGLLGLPYREQTRGPLEVFQEAMAGPTAALAAAGVGEPRRDTAAAEALPGDTYDLAPASSAALGEEAWLAHLTWGAAKAAAVTRPACGVLSTNLLDIDRIERAAGPHGYRVERLASADALSSQAIVFVDLEQAAADIVIRAAAERGIRVVAFGPHVDDLVMIRARSLGAAEAVPRSRFFRDPAAFLPTYL